MKNICEGNSIAAQIVRTIDNMLNEENEFITPRDVLEFYNCEREGSYNRYTLEGIPNYVQYKKAVSRIQTYLKQKGLSLEFANGSNSGDGFRYPAQSPTPLSELRDNKSRKLSKKMLLDFCDACSGLVPESWIAYFMEGTQFLLEKRNVKNAKKNVVSSEGFNKLKNIEQLPIIYNALSKQCVISFDYSPSFRDKRHIVLHPHYLKQFNSRWFIYGYAIYDDGREFPVTGCAIDRIMGTVSMQWDILYIKQQDGFYEDYFSNVVGVHKPSNAIPLEIIIKTRDEYTHMRIITKKIHHTQKELAAFNDGEGRISIQVIPNLELLGLLLSFEDHIEIEGEFRDSFANVIRRMDTLYNGSSQNCEN